MSFLGNLIWLIFGGFILSYFKLPKYFYLFMARYHLTVPLRARSFQKARQIVFHFWVIHKSFSQKLLERVLK